MQLQMYYGLQILIYNITITSLILVLSNISGTFIETLLLFAVFGTLRTLTCGFHFNSVWKCIITTTLIMIGGGKCAQLLLLSLPTCILLCVFINIIFFNHVPRGTPKNPYSLEYSRLQQKRLRIASISLTLIAVSSASMLREIIVIAMSIVIILLLPTYYHRFQ